MSSRTKKKIIIVALVTVVALVLVLGIFKLFGNKQGGSFETNIQNTITYNGEKYRKKDLVNVLIMGIDKDKAVEGSGFYYNDGRADFLALVSVDVFTKSYTILHLNRDTITDVNVYGVRGEYIETRKEQLALAHTYGDGLAESCEYTEDAVSTLLNGIKIDYYLSLNMPAVGILNDEIGGVTLTFDRDYTDISPDYTSGATVTLNGTQALQFVRSRINVDDGTNTARMERQKLYVEAFITQLAKKSKADGTFLNTAFEKVEDYAVTDCSVGTFSRLFGYVSDYTCTANAGLEGEQRVGEKYMEFHVNEEKKTQLIMAWFYNKVGS